jgi:uncharacterized protein (TIGR00251 family)
VKRASDGGAAAPVRITVYVQPRASVTEAAGKHGDCLRIRLAAPPIDNAANQALVAWVAGKLGLPKRQVRLVGGLTSRRKTLEIQGASAAAVIAALS